MSLTRGAHRLVFKTILCKRWYSKSVPSFADVLLPSDKPYFIKAREAVATNIATSQLKHERPTVYEFERASEMRQLNKAIDDREVVIVTGLREAGKTSLCVQALQEDVVIYINLKLRNPRNESEMFVTFVRQIAGSYRNIVRDTAVVNEIFSNFGLKSHLNHKKRGQVPRWENLSELMFYIITQIRSELDRSNSSRRLVVFIDEVNLLYKLSEWAPTAVQTLFSMFTSLSKEFKRCSIVLPTATGFFLKWSERRTQLTGDSRIVICVGDLTYEQSVQYWTICRKKQYGENIDQRLDLFQKAYDVVKGRMINLDRLASQPDDHSFQAVLDSFLGRAKRELLDSLYNPISYLHDRADWFAMRRGEPREIELWNGAEMMKLINLLCESPYVGVVSIDDALRVMERSVINSFIYSGLLCNLPNPVSSLPLVPDDMYPVLCLESNAMLYVMLDYYKNAPKQDEMNVDLLFSTKRR
ncbi:putative ATP-binding protein [Acrasis kona]|uniref:ATP-binding protein n=1 Tax=Acrasis kona TaxID=1008807 RepID=A0AAW2ZK80_9EUKA